MTSPPTGPTPAPTSETPVPLAFTAYSVGLCFASVCTTLTDDEAATRLNAEHPTGIPSPWRPSAQLTFAQGGSNPGPCDTHPETHRHVLFEC